MPEPAGKRPRTKRAINRAQILQKVTTPLGFYVLTLLILEGTLSIVLTCSKLTEEHIWSGFLWMVGVFIGVVILVSLFVWKKPESLLFEKRTVFATATRYIGFARSDRGFDLHKRKA